MVTCIYQSVQDLLASWFASVWERAHLSKSLVLPASFLPLLVPWLRRLNRNVRNTDICVTTNKWSKGYLVLTHVPASSSGAGWSCWGVPAMGHQQLLSETVAPLRPPCNSCEAWNTVLCGQKKWIRACSRQIVKGDTSWCWSWSWHQKWPNCTHWGFQHYIHWQGQDKLRQVSFSILVNKNTLTPFKSCSFTCLHPWIKKSDLCSPRI